MFISSFFVLHPRACFFISQTVPCFCHLLFTLSHQCVFLTFTRALRYCEDMIQRYSRALNNSSLSLSGATLPHCSFSNVGKAVEDCMRAIIGVLLNLTHDNGIPIYCFMFFCICFCFAFVLRLMLLSGISGY